VPLSETDKRALVAFLCTLMDPQFAGKIDWNFPASRALKVD
jgi:hypothetical protein